MDDRSPAARSRTMAAVRSSNTTPEREVRSALHRLGVRYRLGQQIAVGTRRVKPDLAFKGARVALFVDGCFWHGCPDHCRIPATNASYWTQKIRRNRERDTVIDSELEAAGWRVIRAWEHSTPASVARRVTLTLRSRPPRVPYRR